MSEASVVGEAEQRVEVRLPVSTLTPSALWELMWRSTVTPHWLGGGSSVPSRAGERLVLSDAAGPWRRGRSRKSTSSTSVDFVLGPATSWSMPSGGEEVDAVTIAVEVVDENPVVRIAESGPFVVPHREEIRQYWKSVLARLADLLRKVQARRDSPRQAVIVIHGIGEQQPGRTLRALVAAGVIGDGQARTFVKPDRMSGSFELRQATFEATPGRSLPTTDVYELYWAHLIRDTTVTQVAQWARGLLLRTGVPRPLLPAWLLLWAVLLAFLAAALGRLVGLWDIPRWLTAGGVVLVLVSLLWRLVGKGVVVQVLGDAARYLSPRPGNVEHRQAVREAGVNLLERLHRRGDLDRIVVLGHSLGSVIAYDVVTYSWIRLHPEHRHPTRPSFKALRAVERAVGTVSDADAGQSLQHQAWQQIRRNTQPWLVTDLVTVGSPLTYAGFLMATDREEFLAAQRDQILPTCPPTCVPEGKSGHQRFSFERQYVGGDSRGRHLTFTVLTHGAPFAVTRWTNLYFPARWLGLKGDIVGGPVAGEMGAWVKDVPAKSPVRWFAHTAYWRVGPDRAHLEALRRALGPEAGRELLMLAAEMPAYVIAERLIRTERP